MPRYLFHYTGNVRDLDRDGTVMADDAAAEAAAIAFAGETLKHSPKLLRETGQWRVEVTDQRGALLYPSSPLQWKNRSWKRASDRRDKLERLMSLDRPT